MPKPMAAINLEPELVGYCLIEPEFVCYCLKQLTPSQFCVYLVCRMLGQNSKTKLSRIAELCGMASKELVCLHMKSLQNKGFILYSASPRVGTKIIWVKTSQADQVPKLQKWEAA